MPRDQVFVSYSHKDREWLEFLQTMLKHLVRKKLAVWDDTKIKAGAKWKEEIKRALGTAKVAVLIVTPNFSNSDFIAEHELPTLLDAAEKEGLVILWIYASSCLYDKNEIGQYQAAHDITKPLDSLIPAKRRSVLVDVCRNIEAAANIAGPSPDGEPRATRQLDKAAAQKQEREENRVDAERRGRGEKQGGECELSAAVHAFALRETSVATNVTTLMAAQHIAAKMTR